MSTDSLSPRQQPTLALVAAAAIEAAAAAAAAATATAAAAQTKQFACTGCDLSFDRLEHLERHSRIHTGERPFACPFPGCDKTFSRRDNMSQHYRCHLHKGYRNQPREKREVLRKQFQSLGTALLPGNDGCRGGQPGSGPSSSSSSSSSSPSSSSSSSAASSPAASRKLSRRRPPRLQAVPDDAAASMSSPLPSPASSPSSLLSSSSMEDLASRSRSNSCSLSPPQSLRDSFPPASEAPTNLATSFVPTLLTLPALNLPAPVLSQNMLVMSTVDTGMIGLLNQRLRIL